MELSLVLVTILNVIRIVAVIRLMLLLVCRVGSKSWSVLVNKINLLEIIR